MIDEPIVTENDEIEIEPIENDELEQIVEDEIIEDNPNCKRFKNVYFWLGVIAVVLTAMGIAPETLTSWTAVLDAFKDLFTNPFKLGSVIVALIGVYVNPTTKGFKDTCKKDV